MDWARITAPATRSADLLRSGLRSLEQGDMDRAAQYLEALRREGADEDFRALNTEFLRTAAI